MAAAAAVAAAAAGATATTLSSTGSKRLFRLQLGRRRRWYSSKNRNGSNFPSSSNPKQLHREKQTFAPPRIELDPNRNPLHAKAARAQALHSELRDFLDAQSARNAERSSAPFGHGFVRFLRASKSELINIGAAFACVVLAYQIVTLRRSCRLLLERDERRDGTVTELRTLLRHLVAANDCRGGVADGKDGDEDKDGKSVGGKGSVADLASRRCSQALRDAGLVSSSSSSSSSTYVSSRAWGWLGGLLWGGGGSNNGSGNGDDIDDDNDDIGDDDDDIVRDNDRCGRKGNNNDDDMNNITDNDDAVAKILRPIILDELRRAVGDSYLTKEQKEEQKLNRLAKAAATKAKMALEAEAQKSVVDGNVSQGGGGGRGGESSSSSSSSRGGGLEEVLLAQVALLDQEDEEKRRVVVVANNGDNDGTNTLIAAAEGVDDDNKNKEKVGQDQVVVVETKKRVKYAI